MTIRETKDRLAGIQSHIKSMIADESEEYELIPQWRQDVQALETAIAILNKVRTVDENE
jgi:hypothetical protein